MTISTLSIDKEIRDSAARRAKEDKLSVSAVARMLLRDYAQGRISITASFGSSETYHAEFIEVDDELQKEMDKV